MQNNSSDQKVPVEGAIRGYVQDLLRAELAAAEESEKEIRALEEAGHRIVTGGQTGMSSWDIRDWRSGEVIEAGAGGYEEYLAAGERLDPDGKWMHIDQVSEMEDVVALVGPGGVPVSLARALADWIDSLSTPDEDVAAVAGWTVDEVHRHRG